ncbi:UNVERIFIED_CONTAM: hypothetical protein GTU68_021826 [Idotea baltica]|nr:hypothetical protein [Idotea baltica]
MKMYCIWLLFSQVKRQLQERVKTQKLLLTVNQFTVVVLLMLGLLLVPLVMVQQVQVILQQSSRVFLVNILNTHYYSYRHLNRVKEIMTLEK